MRMRMTMRMGKMITIVAVMVVMRRMMMMIMRVRMVTVIVVMMMLMMMVMNVKNDPTRVIARLVTRVKVAIVVIEGLIAIIAIQC